MRPKFTSASEKMRHFSALLAAEVLRWPGTRIGKMFGMQSVYRDEVIFALLPAARCMWESDTIAVKMNNLPGAEGKKWQPLLVRDDSDLQAALQRLEQAYDAAKGL